MSLRLDDVKKKGKKATGKHAARRAIEAGLADVDQDAIDEAISDDVSDIVEAAEATMESVVEKIPVPPWGAATLNADVGSTRTTTSEVLRDPVGKESPLGSWSSYYMQYNPFAIQMRWVQAGIDMNTKIWNMQQEMYRNSVGAFTGLLDSWLKTMSRRDQNK